MFVMVLVVYFFASVFLIICASILFKIFRLSRDFIVVMASFAPLLVICYILFIVSSSLYRELLHLSKGSLDNSLSPP